MKVVVSYPCHNRREYVEITAPQTIDVCREYGEAYLYCGDDNSTDGTWEYLNTLEGFDLLEQREVGNSIWQLNKAFEIAREIGAKYVYAMANDILMPNGIIKEMVEIMEAKGYVSAMIEESTTLPVIGKYNIDENFAFTSSLGIHRVDCFLEEMKASDRFFGFQRYQEKAMKEKGLKCARITGITNTNLDGACWSRVDEYKANGYARKGLISNDRNVYK
jgi:glycosyltransferase involved in cell wall biosynthesis